MNNRTNQSFISIVVCASLLVIGGCRICDSCDDCAYPSYGGSWERTNRNHGRVGSVFAPAGAKVAATDAAHLPAGETWNPNATIDDEEDQEGDDDTRSLLDDLEDDMPDPTNDPVADEA